MKKFIFAVLAAIGLSASAVAQYCPSCIQNSAIAQEAQFNVTSGTVRGKFTVGTLVASAFSMGTSTAAVYYGSGTYLTNLNAAQLLFGFVPTGRLLGPYAGITGVGTLATGVWNGSIIGSPYGGTGANLGTSGVGSIPYFSSVGTMSALSPDTAGKLLQTNGSAAPSWTGAPQVLGTNVTAIPMTNLLTGQLPMSIAVNDASISTVSAAKVIGNIPGNANNIYGFLPLTKLSTGTLINTIVASSITGTGVTPGIYGGPTQLPQLTIGSDGRVSLASQSTFTVSASSIGPGPLPPGVTIGASQITAGNLANTVVASSLTATGVTEGSYGLPTQVSTFTVRKDGRLSSAGSVAIAIPPTQITAGTLPGTVLVPAASIQAGALGPNVLASSLTVTGIPAGSYGGSGQLLQITVNAQGRLTSASTISVPTLSTSVALTNADNAFTAPQTFFGSATINSDLFVSGVIGGNGASISNISPAAIATGTLPSYVVASSITATGVTPGTYGDASHSVTVNVRSDGRVQTITAPSILIPQSGVTGLSSALTSLAASTTTSAAQLAQVAVSTAGLRTDVNALNASTAAIAASVSCQPSAVGGVLCLGSGNTNGFNFGTVSGGSGNSVQNLFGTIGGGQGNLAQAKWSTVPGGHNNLATGQAGIAMGENAENDFINSFVWSDGTFYQDHGGQTFNVHAAGGSFFDAGPVSAAFSITTPSSVTAGAFFGDGSHLSGVSVSTTGLQASLGQSIVTVAPSGAQYTTVGAALTAIGIPTSSTTILIDGGTYTESPLIVPNNVQLIASGRFVTLIMNSASPAITITGSATLEQMNVTNAGGPAIDVVSTSTGVLRFNFLTANGASGYGIRISSSNPTGRFVTATATTGHALWVTGNGGGTWFNSIFTTNGSGNAFYQSGNGTAGLFMACEFRGTTGNAAILLSSATFRVHTAGVCAKAGQPMLDATFNQNGTGFLQEWVDVVPTNLCTGGGGLSRIIGPNVAIFNGQSINGVTIYSAPGNATPPAIGSFMVADGTSSAKWVNSPMYVDVQNSRIGIGTSSPSASLSVSSGTVYEFDVYGSSIVNYSSDATFNPGFQTRAASGSLSNPTAIDDARVIGFLSATGFDGSQYPINNLSPVSLLYTSSGPYTTSSHGAYVSLMTTPVNSTTRAERIRVTDTGNVGIGTTTPSGILEINQPSSNNATSLSVQGNGFVWIGTTSHLGFGVPATSPDGNASMVQIATTSNNGLAQLAVFNDGGGLTAVAQRVYSNTAGNGAFFAARRARGTSSAPLAVQLNDTLVAMNARAFTDTQFTTNTVANMVFLAGEVFSSTSNMTQFLVQVTSKTSITQQSIFSVRSDTTTVVSNKFIVGSYLPNTQFITMTTSGTSPNNVYLSATNGQSIGDNFKRLVLMKPTADGQSPGNVGIGWDNPGEKFVVAITSQQVIAFTGGESFSPFSSATIRSENGSGGNAPLNIQAQNTFFNQRVYVGNVNSGAASEFHVENQDGSTYIGRFRDFGTGEDLAISHNGSPSGMIVESRAASDTSSAILALNPSGGNIGIGILNPQAPLHVVGSSSFTGTAYFGSNLGVAGNISASGNITAPNLGAGTSSPDSALQVVGTAHVSSVTTDGTGTFGGAITVPKATVGPTGVGNALSVTGSANVSNTLQASVVNVTGNYEVNGFAITEFVSGAQMNPTLASGTTFYAFKTLGHITITRIITTINTASVGGTGDNWTCGTAASPDAVTVNTSNAASPGTTAEFGYSFGVADTTFVYCRLDSDAITKPQANVVLQFTSP